MKRLAITGTIGSGKSTFCRLLHAVGGAPVYDCDSRAKEIMNSSAEVREGVVRLFGAEAYAGGVLNRGYISARAFTDKGLLGGLNGVVHPVVVADFERWAESQSGCDYVILESALLFSSPLVGHFDLSVVVDADVELRIERCVARDGMSRRQVEERVANQMSSSQMAALADRVVLNEAGEADLEAQARQIDQLIRSL